MDINTGLKRIEAYNDYKDEFVAAIYELRKK